MLVLFPEFIANNIAVQFNNVRLFSRLTVGKLDSHFLADECSTFPEQFRLVVVIHVELREEDFILFIGKGPSQFQFSL